MTASEDRYCRWLSHYFFVAGYDDEDLYQEARLAMWLAPAGLERVAARRRVIELLRRSKRGGRPTHVELVEAESSDNLVDIAAARAELRRVLAFPLSDLERKALGRVIRGEFCTEKRLDNALQRVRKKLAA